MDNTCVEPSSVRAASLRTRLAVVSLVVVSLWAPSTAFSQQRDDAPPPAPPALDVFRIFLRDGRVLFTEGEYAQVADDLVFVVTQRTGPDADGVVTRDLITIPVAVVDMDRTTEYANALRAAQYGATRGEREYIALTDDIARALAELESSTDPDRRLGIAQVARARLAAWSKEHYGYREADLQHLVGLFDEVIVELQAANGLTQFSLDLVANAAPEPAVPLRPAPTSIESVEMALTAADTTEIGVEKIALLTSASRVVAAMPGASAALKEEVGRRLVSETEVQQAYQDVMREAAADADRAVRQGNPKLIDRLVARVEHADADLGHRRPREVATTLRRLSAERQMAVAQANALARWNSIQDQLRAYDARVKRILNVWSTYEPTLDAVSKGHQTSPAQLDAAVRRFGELDRAMAILRPPEELRDVHGIFRSAVLMARQALVIGQRLSVADNSVIARNASAAVAGAELLRQQAYADLAKGLQPRRVR